MSKTTYDHTVFNQALIKQFEPMIHKLIKKEVHSYNTSDICYDWEDMYQMCLIFLNEAVVEFNSERGMKFENFVWLKLSSRLGNFRNKISKKNFKTSNFTSLNAGWALSGTELSSADHTSNSSFNNKMIGNIDYDQQDTICEMLDAKTVFERLKGDRKNIYTAHYIEGKSVKEICNENSHLKYYQVRRVLKYLEQIHTTLVEGHYV